MTTTLHLTRDTRIFVDMDGVLADLLGRWIAIYREKGGINIHPSDIKAWECPEIPKEHRAWFFEILGEPELFANLDPLPHAFAGMKALLEHFPDTYIVTSSPNKHPNVVADKVRWVQKNLPFFPHDHFISMTPKYLLANENSILIDDSPKNVLDFENHDGQAICIDHPYNRDIDALRATDIRDAVNQILLADGTEDFEASAWRGLADVESGLVMSKEADKRLRKNIRRWRDVRRNQEKKGSENT